MDGWEGVKAVLKIDYSNQKERMDNVVVGFGKKLPNSMKDLQSNRLGQ